MEKSIESHEATETTRWLKNPVNLRNEGLTPDSWVTVNPYYGSRKRVRLRRTSYSFGSAPDSDFAIDDPFVSARHAEIRLTRDGWYEVEDKGSRNGVFLNGTRVLRAVLPNQGILRIGRTKLAWSLETEANDGGLAGMVVRSPAMQAVVERARIAAAAHLPVLILGETGTGKDELARFLHRQSARAHAPFIAVNAATAGGGLVDSEIFGHKKGAYTGSEANRLGAIQAAHRGVLFLDELGDLPLETQAKLLRALETGEVKPLGSDRVVKSDFRLIAATSRDLEAMTAQGDFRLDLFYRVSGFVLRIPPLRERKEEILPLARAFLEGEGLLFDSDCEGRLVSHDWPGNIRELRAVVLRAATIARAQNRIVIASDDIELLEPNSLARLAEASEGRATLFDLEREFIRRALERTGWAKSQAAKELGIARSTLFDKMRRYGIADDPALLTRR